MDMRLNRLDIATTVRQPAQPSIQHRHVRPIVCALLSGWLAITCSPTLAAKLPEAGDVLVGEVTISQPDTLNMLLKQQGNHAAISWRSFSGRHPGRCAVCAKSVKNAVGDAMK